MDSDKASCYIDSNIYKGFSGLKLVLRPCDFKCSKCHLCYLIFTVYAVNFPIFPQDGIRTSNVPMTAEAHVVPKQLSIKYRMLAFPPNVITYKSDKSTLANPPCDVHYPVRVTHIPRRVWINTSDTDLDIYQTYNLLIPDEDWVTDMSKQKETNDALHFIFYLIFINASAPFVIFPE